VRFIAIYLGVYFALLAGALVALWAGGVLAHLPATPVLLFFIVAVGAGVLVAVVWRWNPHRTTTQD
jgi:membrane protein implicated in regulation of membrane protease activity